MGRQARLLGLFLLSAASVVVWRTTSRRSLEWGLRDALISPPPLSPAHASLARDGRSSCDYCHGADAARSAKLAKWGGQAWEASQSAVPGTGVCLSCHDGQLASSVSVHGSHPLGLDYTAARMRDPDRLNVIAENAEVRLEDGRIGCLSCHSIHKLPGGSDRQGIIETSCETCHRL